MGAKLYWHVMKKGEWMWEPSLLGNSSIDQDGRIYYSGPHPHDGDFRLYQLFDDFIDLEVQSS